MWEDLLWMIGHHVVDYVIIPIDIPHDIYTYILISGCIPCRQHIFSEAGKASLDSNSNMRVRRLPTPSWT